MGELDSSRDEEATTSMRGLQTVHGLLLLGLLALPFFFGELLQWPFYLLVPLALYGLLVVTVPQLRRSVRWLRAGSLDPAVSGLTAAVILLSATALVAWYLLFRYDDLGNLGSQLPHWDLPCLLLAGVGFSVLNAVLEEIIFRGVLFEALIDDYGPAGAVWIQGVVFGVVHAHGFPRGIVGVLLASIYGVMLGALRLRAGGLLAPLLAHICADATIFIILLFHLGRI